MDRLVQRNVLATSGRAVEAAGDVDTLLLDKTGTITFGNRQATELIPVGGVDAGRTGRRRRGCPAWPTRRRRAAASSTLCAARARPAREADARRSVRASSSRSPRRPGCAGSTSDGRQIRKGAAGAVVAWVAEHGGTVPRRGRRRPSTGSAARAARRWSSPSGRRRRRVLGVIRLSDVVKPGMRERFAELRAMGIRTVMITGDNPLTARAIAAEAGVDDFLAEATPEDKLALIRKEQEGGRLVAMTGDGTNDAPALAQADVGVAMNTGTRRPRRPATWSTSTPTRPS